MHQRLDHAKKSATNALKASNRVIQKAAEATGDLAGNSVIVTYVHDKETPKERYISTMKRQEAIDELILT